MKKFSKVSYEQYAAAVGGDVDLREEYEAIKLPRRATTGSGGYDFFAPCDICLAPGEDIKIPTGIRVALDQDKLLACFPRSGLGFKYRLMLNNTVGIIDSDYYGSSNEGHMFAKLYNNGNQDVFIKKGEAFMQGIILQYFLTDDDDADGVRDGGFGSTG